ncbi:c-type cytochrome [Aquimarina intermedia]|uniref:Cytochrome c domain-containing protein n=1 Tax=Aquimarina intermedia TaxID=350814 RepID=A0A5S5BXD5_9FLAO|nr:cytochrome c [Aquimarina intermedia]TYP71697.1 hypothetical protein BD809_108107 [Aquimarina intermedia]
MKKSLFYIIPMLVVLGIIGCSSSDSDEMENIEPPTSNENPIPSKRTTYDDDIKAIFESQCLQCHNNPPTQGAPMALSTYSEVIAAINNGRDVIGRVNTTATRNVMPPTGRLPQETVTIILDWEADGFLEK